MLWWCGGPMWSPCVSLSLPPVSLSLTRILLSLLNSHAHLRMSHTSWRCDVTLLPRSPSVTFLPPSFFNFPHQICFLFSKKKGHIFFYQAQLYWILKIAFQISALSSPATSIHRFSIYYFFPSYTMWVQYHPYPKRVVLPSYLLQRSSHYFHLKNVFISISIQEDIIYASCMSHPKTGYVTHVSTQWKTFPNRIMKTCVEKEIRRLSFFLIFRYSPPRRLY